MVPKDYGKPKEIIDHDNSIVFLFFGGVRSTKRFDVLLDAFLSLDYQHLQKAELWVYGNCDGEEKDKYLSKSKEYTNIKMMLDFVPDDLVPTLFCSASYLVQPYQQITQSGPMMIAYNYNLPIIASDIDGFKERIIDGKSGFLFKKNDVVDLTRVLTNCIDLPDSKYLHIKTKMQDFVEREYSLKIVTQRYREMLNNFIESNE